MAAKFIGNVQLTALELKNLTSNPTAIEGAFIYNTTDKKYYGSTDGSTWAEIGAASSRYEEAFTSATTWTMTHNLGSRPTVSILDSSDYVIVPDTVQITTTQVIATFTSAVAGRMIVTI